MHPPDDVARRANQWYRSFYWRIAASFVVLVVAVLVGQSAIFSYVLTRPSGQFAPGDPNRAATAVAARLRTALMSDPAAALELIVEASGGRRQAIYVVMKDGRDAANTSKRCRPHSRQVDAALGGVHRASSDSSSGPVVSAPVQVDRELCGLVVLPPPPPRGVLARSAGCCRCPAPWCLVSAAALSVVIFAPARRRLHALEQTAQRIGAGDCDVRAEDGGQRRNRAAGAAFNRMASELAARTEALHTSDRLRRQMLADVSHELRTPLTAMRGYLDTLRCLTWPSTRRPGPLSRHRPS